MRVTDEMVLAGAREVCARWSAACGVDPEDNWKIYSDEHKAEARAILTAALSHAAGQEVDDSLPRPLWPVSKEWYRLCERRFAVDRITISGKLAEAIVDAVCGPAIAAQRKEGE